MCGLCGIFSEPDLWNQSPNTDANSLRRNRLIQINYLQTILTHIRLRVSDVHGVNYLLEDFKGNQKLFSNLHELWQSIEELTGEPLDPFNNELLQHLERGHNND
ncbi:hypothetical protein Q4583_02590 [Neptunomonas phycophila]|jgi:hypothetical protein|uniref:hypothetical protein n=1 Tax=Neptunomonas phycophila TaxID=1572645 RepID=UPI00094897AF|nr:hypothetical protein [Neptunomonas phycophila]MBT3146344.1 hypothetical protein [Neptunomonas phycophila]MDO6466579.1 hypothetical protein [Neptunomonas phycophila]MDO6782987.1 hypothetical protein [Neptunomonas phycophila]